MKEISIPACLLLASCVSYEPAVLIPAVTLSAEDIELVDAGSNQNLALDFGLITGINESDSLLNVEILPGVRVQEVTANGAADSAGIQVGDIILSVDGMDTNHPDVLISLQQQAREETDFEFSVRRNTTVFAATVAARTVTDSTPPQELYRLDPIATRAGYRTELVNVRNQNNLAAARVVELFPGSPLPEAGINIGDMIISIDDASLNSAQDLVTRLNQDYALGTRVTFVVFDGQTVADRSVRLWDPGRRISRISLGPLLNYEASLSPESHSFSLLDLWLFSLYSYRQVEGERSHSLLGLFNFTSDYGELIEEQD